MRFAEVPDRSAAEQARGAAARTSTSPPDEAPEDPEEFYDHQLVGLTARTPTAHRIGVVAEVVHRAGQDLLVLDADGREVLVPFVTALVPEVDVAGGRRGRRRPARPGRGEPE